MNVVCKLSIFSTSGNKVKLFIFSFCMVFINALKRDVKHRIRAFSRDGHGRHIGVTNIETVAMLVSQTNSGRVELLFV